MNKEQALQVIDSFIKDANNRNLNMNDAEGRRLMLDALLLLREYIEGENEVENAVSNTLRSLGLKN